MVQPMRCVVVGAGAWGLPAAAELALRGHQVLLVDRHGVASPLSSSSGPTRLWRLTHPDRVRVRLARRSVEAMQRLARLAGTEVHLRRGLLWRDDASLPAVTAALSAEDVPHEVVGPEEVGRFLPGLRPDGRAAVWQPDAGPVLAEVSLRAQRALLESAGGRVLTGVQVLGLQDRADGVRVLCRGRVLDADVAVLAAGPGMRELLPELGIEVPLQPVLEQVVHLGRPGDSSGTDGLACLYEGPRGAEPGLYAMPSPGVGYKVGLDRRVRDLEPGDLDRSPDPGLTETVRARVARDLSSVPATPLDAQVCSWTLSPDGRFIIDTLPGGIVIAAGDSGEGFKFSALMGLVLADLAEGRDPDADIAAFGLARLSGPSTTDPAEHVLGR